MLNKGIWNTALVFIMCCFNGMPQIFASDSYSLSQASGYQKIKSQIQPAYQTNTLSEQNIAVGDYQENRLAQLAAEIDAIKGQLNKKDEKKPSQGFSAPKIGGRFFMDYVDVLNQNTNDANYPIQGNQNGSNWFGFREARITFTGTGYDYLDYKLELGFEKGGASNNVSYKDIFLGIKHVPVFNYVRIGHQYVENAGSEICNGTTYYTFMESPAPAGDQFMSRRLGISSRHLFCNDRGRLFLGVFGAENINDKHYYKNNHQGIVLNTRLTFAPMFHDEGRKMFLFGGYYSYVDSEHIPSVQARPGGWGVYADFNTAYDARDYQKAGLEAVYQNSRLCLQGEFFVQQYDGVARGPVYGDETNVGGFAMIRWFLSEGDYRKYSQSSACWGGVNVNCPFVNIEHNGTNKSCGLGAWEIAAMYGFLDEDWTENLNQQVGVALNWYWNPQVKWAVNYIHDMTEYSNTIDDYRYKGDVLGVSCRVAF